MPATTPCDLCGDAAHTVEECPDRYCYTCGTYGHLASQRPYNCENCASHAHSYDECPQGRHPSCSICGSYYHEPNRHQCGSCGEYGHIDRDCCDAMPVREWSYRPTLQFHGDGPTYLGFELEIEAPRYNRDAYRRGTQIARQEIGDLVYLKSDGSINYGFEMVSHPMAYTWAMDNFPWPALTHLHEIGFRAQSNCGLHVHVSRAAFSTPSHLYRWMKLIYRNAEEVQALARRRNSGYAPFAPSYRRVQKDIAKSPMLGQMQDRYQAINPTNTDTLEVRVFRSSLTPSNVQTALGLVDASVQYTRQLTAHDVAANGGWSWAAFRLWARKAEIYGPLVRQMSRRRPALPNGAPPARDSRVRWQPTPEQSARAERNRQRVRAAQREQYAATAVSEFERLLFAARQSEF